MRAAFFSFVFSYVCRSGDRPGGSGVELSRAACGPAEVGADG